MIPDDVVARIRAGDAQAFELVFRTYYSALIAFTRRFVESRAIAEEVVQELFADIWVDRATLRVQSTLRGYLYAAVRNRSLNVRRRRLVEDRWSRAAVDPADGHLHPVAGIDDELERDDQYQRLVAALASLPPRMRLTMELRWRDRLSYQEIAEALDISAKGVENQLARGLKALREVMRGSAPDGMA
ncbi:MAG: sigma-70 family RNA polymerase sigma factor [bacterium]